MRPPASRFNPSTTINPPALFQQFVSFLDREGIKYTLGDLRDNAGWIKQHIKREVFTYQLGQPEGYKVSVDNDPQVAAASELIPQARALYATAERIVAERQAAALPRHP